MSLEKLVSKYIASTEHVLKDIEVVGSSFNVGGEDVGKVMGYVKDYLEDAKFYRDKERMEVSLASVAYCEGLLDALKLLGTVEFEWAVKKGKRREG